MPGLETLNHVWLGYPGTAWTLPPSFGIHHEWTTSWETIVSVIVVLVGTTIFS